MARYTVRFTKGAQGDLADLHRRKQRSGGLAAADLFLDDMLEAISSLEAFPLRGSIPQELQSLGWTSIRQHLSQDCRLLTRVDDSVVTIILAIDARRSFRRLLEQRVLR
ncbi:MAG: type II toxin-antitoxin system RelE/ParE family toxin [Pseudomonadota bacterium]